MDNLNAKYLELFSYQLSKHINNKEKELGVF